MALNIRIDVRKSYDFTHIDNDLRYSSFESDIADGTNRRLGIRISTDPHPLLPDVYNLAFGPSNGKNEIDDTIKLRHNDHSKVFSTITLAALKFLDKNRQSYLGIDGSDTRRAYMYYRCILNNFDYLDNLFVLYGVNYYCRIRRDNDSDNDFDRDDFICFPTPIEKGQPVCPRKLYNYLIFRAK